MSFGDLEYQETSNHFLTRLLKSMKQEQIILDAIQNPIDDVEEYPDSRLVNSIIGTKDNLGAVAKVATGGVSYTLPSEPSYRTKLWLWFREAWRVKDHSLFGNQAFFETKLPPAVSSPLENYVPIRRKVSDDGGLTDGRDYRATNGVNQYCRVKASDSTRISKLLETETDLTFSIFFSPYLNYTIENVPDIPWCTLIQEMDDDQVSNAVKVDVNTTTGAVRFRLVYKGNAYELISPSNAVPITELPEFIPGEFLPAEFITASSKPWQYTIDQNPPDWTWLFFTFNKNTRILQIFKVADGGFAAAQIATSSTNETGLRSTFGLHIPANEGGTDATTAYDIINSNHAVFATVAPNNPPSFITGGGIRLDSNTDLATIANHSSIDVLSVFTIAFKIKLYSYSPDASTRAIFSKNIAGGTVAGSFGAFMAASGSSTLSFSLRSNANVFRQPTATNAIASLNTWYDVILTYDGSTYNLSVGSTNASPVSGSGDIYTTSNPIRIGASLTNSISAANCEIAHFIIDKGTAWGASQKSWFASLQPGFKAGFPTWKPPKPPEPEESQPVVRPMQQLYALSVPDDITTQKVNAPQSATPFVSEYNVLGGTPSTTPEELKYDVADGTTGGGSTSPVVEIYNLAAASSTGNIENNERAYIQRIDSTQSNLYGEKPTYLSFWVDSDGNADGQVYACVFRSNGSYEKFGSAINGSSLGGGWTQITRSSYIDRTALAVGDGVGIVWENNNSGRVHVRRGGENNHDDENGDGSVQYSWQWVHTGSAWGGDVDRFSIAGVVKTGGVETSGSNPFFKMGTSNNIMANFQLNSVIENIVPTRVIWRARRVGSAASAVVVCRIRNSSASVVYTFPQTYSFNSIGTTVQDLEFSDTGNTIQWSDSFRITLEYSVQTGISDSTNYLEVNFNVGPNNAGMVFGNAVKAQKYTTGFGASYSDVSPTGTDWAGKIYIGGASFSSYKELNNSVTRVGEKVAQFASPNISVLHNDKLTKWNITMKKEGNPEGPIRVKCYNGAGAESAVFTTILDASGLTTSDAVYPFIYLLNNFAMDGNSRIVVEYENGTATDKVLVKINKDSVVGAAADGTKSILTSWNGSAWVDDNTLDVSGEIFTGGVPDTNSRPKVAVRNDSEFGRLMQKKVTKVIIKLKKLGAPTGTYYIRTVRGSDGSNRDLIGSGNIEDLSTSAWTPITKENFNAVHYMAVSDKVVVEYEGGNLDNCLLVQVKKDSTYDDEDSIYEEFDAITWNKPNLTWDLACEIWTGGDTYIPDAGTPYSEPPDYYEHDLLIGGGHSGFLNGQVDSFYGMRQRDFRIFTESLTLEEFQTLYDNKWSKRGAAGSLALVSWFTLTDQTEP